MLHPVTRRRWRAFRQARKPQVELHLEFLEDRNLLDAAAQPLFHPEAVLRSYHSASDPASKPSAVTSTERQTPPPTPENVLVNDPAEDGNSVNDTHSETTVIAYGSTVLAGYNDSFNASHNHYTGFSYSSDSGATFTDGHSLPLAPDGNGDGGDPVLAHDNQTGRTYMAVLGYTDGSKLYIWRSDDDLHTFLPGVSAAPGRSGLDKEWLAVDNYGGAGQGNVYLVTRDFSSGNGIFLFKSTDQGATFGPSGGTLIASGASGNVQGAWVTVGPDHTVYASWFDNTTSTQKIMMRRSTDQGATFGAPVTVATLHTTGVNGDLGLGGFRSNAFAQAVVNPVSGDVYVTFDDKGTGNDRADVYFTLSTDGGATWAAPVKVNDGPVGRDAWQPAIGVSPNGSKVGIFWYDRRNDAANNLIDRYGALGTVGSGTVTFGPNMRISDTSFAPEFGHDPAINPLYMGDYDSVAATTNSFYLTWGDNRTSFMGHFRPDVRLARIPLEVAGPSVIATSPAGNTFSSFARVRVSFDEQIDPGTFTADQVLFLSPSGRAIPVTDITPVTGSNDTQFDLSFATQTGLGNYTMVIGPNITDTAGNPMDQNGNGIPGEVPGDQYITRFTLLGPKVTATTPSLLSPDMFGPVATVRVTFNEPMDPTTFTPAKISNFFGPRGPITVTGVTAVAGSNNTQFDIAFAAQGATGYYTMAIGPDIRDAAGHQMDQNGNFIPGEIPDDQYVARFRLKGPAITARSPSATTFSPGQVNSFTVTFSEPMNPASFTPSTVVFMGPAGAVPVTGVVPVSGSNNTQFNILFNPVAIAGHYTVVIGPNVLDTFGNPMDQNGNFYPGEIPGDQYNFAFDITGPKITSNTPNLTSPVLGQVNSLRVTFNQSIDPITFTPDKITSFTGPNGPIEVTGVFSVGGSNNTQFDITFGPQVTTGRYSMVFGMGIRDYFGNQADPYTAMFGIQGPKVIGSTPSGTANLPGVIDHVRLTFNESMDPATFTMDQVVSFSGPNGAVPITDLQVVPNTGNTQFDISFDPLTAAGTYRLAVGPNIQDIYGNAMDQNGNLVPGEVPGDEYTTSFGVAGPMVVSLLRNGPPANPVSSFRVTFNEPIDPATFTADRVTRLDDPSGNPITVQNITAVTGSNNTQFDVSFDQQTARGTYTAVLGAGISDRYGNTTTTAFTATFVVTPVYAASGYTYEDLDIHGMPGTFRVIQYADDSAAAVNLGTHTFNFFGVIYTGNNQLFAGSNGLINFGSGYTTPTNTDLTTNPPQATIAPIWSDWIKTSGTDMIEGLIDTVNDRLILQWNMIQHYPSSPMGITFQLILQLDTGGVPGDIVFNYVNLDSGDMHSNGATSTVGIKDTGTQGPDRVLVSYNMLNMLVGSQQAILISATAGGAAGKAGHRPGALRANTTAAPADPTTWVVAPVAPHSGAPLTVAGDRRVLGRDDGASRVVDAVFASVAEKGRALASALVHTPSLADAPSDLFADLATGVDLF